MTAAAPAPVSARTRDHRPPPLPPAPATSVVEALGSLGVPLRGAEVVLVSGSFGAGHDAAAAEVADRLAAAGARSRTLDVVDLFPVRTGRLVRWAYPRLLRCWPAGWALVLGLLVPGRPGHRAVTAALGRLAGRLDGALEGAGLVVSTHPFASQALGCARATGRLRAPVATYLTDPSVHALWVHPHVDLHLALHGAASAQTAGLLAAYRRADGSSERLRGPARVALVEALVPATYASGRPADPTGRVRRALGVAPETPLLLVVGGSLGVGRLGRTARDLRDAGCGTPVVVCGRNERLRRRLQREPGVVAVGWRTDLPDLIRAADCVVQNAGGFTAWESLAAGTPVVTYRAIRGHGETNAAALASDGLVPWPRSPAGLRAVVAAACAPPVTLPTAS